MGGDGSAEADRVGIFAQRADAEGDVFFERDAEFFGAFADVFARDAAGEGFILQALFHRIDFQIENTFRRADVTAGGEKAGEFIAGKERVLERRLARDTGIVRMRENGADNFFGVAQLAEDLCAFGGMLLVCGVGVVGPAFVVEIVEQGGEAPEFFVGAVLAGVGADAGFDGEHVFAQAFGLGVFAEKFPGVVAGRHAERLLVGCGREIA